MLFAVSFLRTESFLSMRFLIQGSGCVPLSFFFGIKSAMTARTASFQQRQSLLMSAASGEIKFDKFAARREERSPLKSPFFFVILNKAIHLWRGF